MSGEYLLFLQTKLSLAQFIVKVRNMFAFSEYRYYSLERLRCVAPPSRFAALAESKKKEEEDQQTEIEAGKALQKQIINALRQLPAMVITNLKEFLPLFEKTLKPFKLRESVKNVILKALTERDESTELIPTKKGDGYEPDPELRDYENVTQSASL